MLQDRARVIIPAFLRSEIFAELLQALNENPSLGRGLPLLANSNGWLGMFIEATKKLPYAIVVSNMQVAGLPIVYVNEAFERLTEYSREEAIGRNCRFLQGCDTEDDAVRETVSCISDARVCTVRLTNYKKSGTKFINDLTLRPVYDSRGVYRFCVGVQSEVDQTAVAAAEAVASYEVAASVAALAAEKEAAAVARYASLVEAYTKEVEAGNKPNNEAELEVAEETAAEMAEEAVVAKAAEETAAAQAAEMAAAARMAEMNSESDEAMRDTVNHAIPSKYPACLNDPSPRRVQAFDILNNDYQYDESRLQFARVACLNDLRGSLEKMLPLVSKPGSEAQKQFLRALPDEDTRYRVQLVLRVAEALRLPRNAQIQAAHDIYEELLMPAGGEYTFKKGKGGTERLLQRLREEREAALDRLADETFYSCLDSPHLTEIFKEHSKSLLSGSLDDLWSGWSVRCAADWSKVPPEVNGWLRAFVEMMGSNSVPICLSDMSLSGNPLIYVNKAWCANSGYTSDEVLGRNCRFLQGPLTEAAAVKQLVAALRDGTDACVRITNYRKSGEAFANLVVLRPVHDSNGVYRFCISMAVVLGEEVGLDERLWQLTRSMEFMPHSISYCNVRTPLTPRIRLP